MRVVQATVTSALVLAPAFTLTADGGGDTARQAFTVPEPPRRIVPAVAPVVSAAPASAIDSGPVLALGPAPRQLTVPDLAVINPAGIADAQVSAVNKLPGVRAVLSADGGEVRVDGHPAAVLGVAPTAFRSWAPPVTAANLAVWAALAANRMVSTNDATLRLGLATGTAYPVAGAATVNVPFGTTALLGIPGIDLVVNGYQSSQLGLVQDAVLLVNAPGADLRALTGKIRRLLGKKASVIALVPEVNQVTATPGLPVDTVVPAGRPVSYLDLFRESAARYCPGLSWTVLAAIGQVESGDGANDGPSPAGALGPMQFMPGTWAAWGIDAFGQTGPPNVMNPLDAVPSAARMLCADGAAGGGRALSAAIYDYNHATWYVTEILQLASEYAHEYP